MSNLPLGKEPEIALTPSSTPAPGRTPLPSPTNQLGANETQENNQGRGRRSASAKRSRATSENPLEIATLFGNVEQQARQVGATDQQIDILKKGTLSDIPNVGDDSLPAKVAKTSHADHIFLSTVGLNPAATKEAWRQCVTLLHFEANAAGNPTTETTKVKELLLEIDALRTAAKRQEEDFNEYLKQEVAKATKAAREGTNPGRTNTTTVQRVGGGLPGSIRAPPLSVSHNTNTPLVPNQHSKASDTASNLQITAVLQEHLTQQSRAFEAIIARLQPVENQKTPHQKVMKEMYNLDAPKDDDPSFNLGIPRHFNEPGFWPLLSLKLRQFDLAIGNTPGDATRQYRVQFEESFEGFPTEDVDRLIYLFVKIVNMTHLARTTIDSTEEDWRLLHQTLQDQISQSREIIARAVASAFSRVGIATREGQFVAASKVNAAVVPPALSEAARQALKGGVKSADKSPGGRPGRHRGNCRWCHAKNVLYATHNPTCEKAPKK